MTILEIKNLHASVDGKSILRGVNLTVKSGETHAIMGPNGTGKSTLASVIMGHPTYEVTEGEILLDGENVLEMEPDERARAGLFLAMQSPQEVPGVTNSDFLKTAVEAHYAEQEKPFKIFDFIKKYDQAIESLKMDKDVPERYLNDGFSGGEKKRNEILQMKLIQPKIAILDEIDSGLDVDALKIVGENVTEMQGEGLGMILITHYQRMLQYIKADTIHVMMKGKVVKSGGLDLMKRIDEEGYDWIKEELGIDDERVITEEDEPTFLQTDSLADALKK